MAGGRPSRASHRGQQIIIALVKMDLWAFWRKALDVPVIRVPPGIVNMFNGPCEAKTIVR
jgi:hypothetical protein